MSSAEALQILAELRELRQLVAKRNQVKHWYTTDEACEVLGLSKTDQGPRQLTWFCEHSYITLTRNSRPKLYNANQVDALCEMINKGLVAIPYNIKNKKSRQDEN